MLPVTCSQGGRYMWEWSHSVRCSRKYMHVWITHRRAGAEMFISVLEVTKQGGRPIRGGSCNNS